MLLFRQRRPSEIQEFVKNNSAADLDGTAGDSWKKYLYRNGGAGAVGDLVGVHWTADCEFKT